MQLFLIVVLFLTRCIITGTSTWFKGQTQDCMLFLSAIDKQYKWILNGTPFFSDLAVFYNLKIVLIEMSRLELRSPSELRTKLI